MGEPEKNSRSPANFKTRVISECWSEPCRTAGKPGTITARLPVVLGKSKVHIGISAGLYFEDFLKDIVRCDCRLRLESCKLLDMGERHGKLYLEGFVDEQVEHTGTENGNEHTHSSVLRFLSLHIPFSGTVRIDYLRLPVFKNYPGFHSVTVCSTAWPGQDGGNAGTAGSRTADPDKLFCEIDNASVKASIDNPFSYLKDGFIKEYVYREIEQSISCEMTVTLFQEHLVALL